MTTDEPAGPPLSLHRSLLHRLNAGIAVSVDFLTWFLVRLSFDASLSRDDLRRARTDGFGPTVASEPAAVATPAGDGKTPINPRDPSQTQYIFDLLEEASQHTDNKTKLFLTLSASFVTLMLALSVHLPAGILRAACIIPFLVTIYLCFTYFAPRRWWIPEPRQTPEEWASEVFVCYTANDKLHNARLPILSAARRWFFFGMCIATALTWIDATDRVPPQPQQTAVERGLQQIATEIRGARAELQQSIHANGAATTPWTMAAWAAITFLLVGGAALVVAGPSVFARVAGLGMIALGGLTTSAHLIDEAHLDSFVRIGRVVIGADGASSDSTIWRHELQHVAAISSYPMGKSFPTASMNVTAHLDSAINAWNKLTSAGGSGYVMLVGGVDRVPTRRHLDLQYGGNPGLAHSRAATVRDLLVERGRQSGCEGLTPDHVMIAALGAASTSDTLILPGGYPEDRRVDVYISATLPYGAPHQSRDSRPSLWYLLGILLSGVAMGLTIPDLLRRSRARLNPSSRE